MAKDRSKIKKEKGSTTRKIRRQKPLDRFYNSEVGDPSFVNRYIYEKMYLPNEFDPLDQPISFSPEEKAEVIETFAAVWEKTALMVWLVCQEDDKEEPVIWTC